MYIQILGTTLETSLMVKSKIIIGYKPITGRPEEKTTLETFRAKVDKFQLGGLIPAHYHSPGKSEIVE